MAGNADLKKAIPGLAALAGLAALLTYPERFRNRKVGLVLCGGNIDNRLLSAILQRQLAREGRLIRLRADLSDQAGTLAKDTVLTGRFKRVEKPVDVREIMREIDDVKKDEEMRQLYKASLER